MNIKIITELNQLEPYREAWTELLDRTGSKNIFLRSEWLINWWLSFGENKSLLILIIEKNNKIIGIAPFYQENKSLFNLFPISQIRFMGDTHVGSDFLDILVDPTCQDDVHESFFKVLTSQISWNRLFFDDALSTSSFIAYIQSQELNTYLKRKYLCPYIELPENMESFLKLKDVIFKKIIRKKTSTKLKKEHRIEFISRVSPSELSSYLNKLIELHQERWQGEAKKGIFNNKLIKSFYENISQDFIKKDLLRMSALKIDDKIEVVEYGMVYQDHYFSLQGGCSQLGFKLHAGNVLTLNLFESIMGHIKVFQYLRGAEKYKYLWGAQDQQTIRFQCWRKGDLIGLAMALEKIGHIIKSKIKKLLK